MLKKIYPLNRWATGAVVSILTGLALVIPVGFVIATAPAARVADIDTDLVPADGLYPSDPVQVGEYFFYSAMTAPTGSELWKSDGTAAGTQLLMDICPGSDCSGGPSLLADVDGTLFFAAHTESTGDELWKSDGTPGGTVLVKDICPGDCPAVDNGLEDSQIAVLGGHLYFPADDGVHGTELWRSDGTLAGTVLVKDIFSGTWSSEPDYLVVMDGLIYFSAEEAPPGPGELWASDGTLTGTVVVSQDLGAANLYPFGGELFFIKYDAAVGSELWKSDGTASGTVLVADICPGTCSSSPDNFVGFNGRLYFIADDGSTGYELWATDGTEAGTALVSDVCGGTCGSYPMQPTESNGQLFFYADDGVSGQEPWKTDGTDAGTSRVADICPGACPSTTFPVPYPNFEEFNGLIYFQASDGVHGGELWKTDGTEAGTTMVKDIFPGPGNAVIPFIENINGTLILGASDEDDYHRMWKSDGTEGGTVPMADITKTADSYPYGLTALGDRMFFSAAHPDTGRELWASDGTISGTVLVKDIFTGTDSSAPEELTELNEALYFVADDGVHGKELWASDGTLTGTAMIRDICTGDHCYTPPGDLTVVIDILFFAANAPGGVSGIELWKSDGTLTGTVMVKGFSAGGLQDTLTAYNGALYFSAADGTHGAELWRSDGTLAGTVMVKDINLNAGSSQPYGFVEAGGTLFFTADDGTHGRELWKSDGTEAGTVMVKDICPDSCWGLEIPELTYVNGFVYFVGIDADNDYELWRSDGTEAGTVLVKDITPGDNYRGPFGLTAAGDSLFFFANDGMHGWEPWMSDGTNAGTQIVMDINPGPVESMQLYPELDILAFSDGTVLFSAADGAGGLELWRHNPAANTTYRVQDIALGPAPAGPDQFSSLGSTLYFRADDGETGSELWALALDSLDFENIVYLPLVRH